jgi:hypothetical protein
LKGSNFSNLPLAGLKSCNETCDLSSFHPHYHQCRVVWLMLSKAPHGPHLTFGSEEKILKEKEKSGTSQRGPLINGYCKNDGNQLGKELRQV